MVQPFERPVLLISACLAGVHCRWDGSSRLLEELGELQRCYELVPVCPEQLGGLPTPRRRSSLVGGDGAETWHGRAHLNFEDGSDSTEFFLNGARETLRIAHLCCVRLALLKEGSPSCGVSRITISGEKVLGRGVTAALLAEEGIAVFSEEDIAVLLR
ncbi:MAG: DUF523 domain-containing protein [bacterium]